MLGHPCASCVNMYVSICWVSFELRQALIKTLWIVFWFNLWCFDGCLKYVPHTHKCACCVCKLVWLCNLLAHNLSYATTKDKLIAKQKARKVETWRSRHFHLLIRGECLYRQSFENMKFTKIMWKFKEKSSLIFLDEQHLGSLKIPFHSFKCYLQILLCQMPDNYFTLYSSVENPLGVKGLITWVIQIYLHLFLFLC